MNGPKGKRGPIASCQMCGKDATEITWDAELDVCTCGNCGWTNRSENLDLYPTDPGPKTPMTNADRINAMSIEEKAEFLILSPEMEFDVCRYCEHVNPTPTDDRGWCLHNSEVRGYGICLASARAEAFKKWLQQPVKEGADQ